MAASWIFAPSRCHNSLHRLIQARWLCAVAALGCVLSAQTATIRLENGVFRVPNWSGASSRPDSGWESVFAIYAGAGDVPPMTGTYAVAGSSLVFRPRYPLTDGVTYRAVLQVGSSPPVEASFQAPSRPRQSPVFVSHVYPSTDVLPENALKLYIEFSGPMSRGFAWQHLRLLNADGSPVDLPFLEVEQELWDTAYRRMTVLFDPGRIKRGLVPNQSAGDPIEEGKQYTLVIDRSWPDSNGNPLAQEFRKTIHVGPAIRTGIDLANWRITPGEVLVVEFPRPLDHALLSHALRVAGPYGELIDGRSAIDKEETRWTFKPALPWQPGAYRLVIDMTLEDLAGNRIGRAFDVDVFGEGSERITRKTAELAFRITR